MSKIVCPYCFELFDQSEVMFRCSNVLGCTKVEDTALVKYWKGGVPMEGLSFKPKTSFLSSIFGGVPRSAKCPKCNHETVSLICPHCHNQLPRRLVERKGCIISIIGARSSGKTNYIATLINQLQANGIHLNNMGVMLSTIAPTSIMHRWKNADREMNSVSRYEEDFFDPVYMKKICPEQTQVGEGRSKYPIIVELSQKNKPPLHLVFYDTAGENFNMPRNIAANVQYMLRSDAFIFLLDTAEIPFIRERLNKGYTQQPFDSIVATVKDFFDAHPDSKEFFKKPIAFTFNKIDLILKNQELFRDSSIPGMTWESNSSYLDGMGVNLAEIDSISDGLKSALCNCWGESNFVTSMENSYKNLKFFGVSGLGEDPPVSKKITNLRPYRVLDPLVWILSEFNYSLPIVK